MTRAYNPALHLASAALLLMLACGKKKAEPQEAPETQSAVEQPDKKDPGSASTGQPKGPTGVIEGRVNLTGEAPAMPTLQRGSDPACNTKTALAETVMVDDTGGLANVLIRIKPGTVAPWTPPKKVVVDQVDCMYRPRVQGGVRGQKVEVLNSDPTMHNVHTRLLELGKREDSETLMNRAQPPDVEIAFELDDEPIVKLECDVHPWMQGFILVSDNPYQAVTDREGRYKLEHVPAGEQTVEIWHEFYGLKEARVTVKADGTVALNPSYDADKDNPRKAQNDE